MAIYGGYQTILSSPAILDIEAKGGKKFLFWSHRDKEKITFNLRAIENLFYSNFLYILPTVCVPIFLFVRVKFYLVDVREKKWNLALQFVQSQRRRPLEISGTL